MTTCPKCHGNEMMKSYSVISKEYDRCIECGLYFDPHIQRIQFLENLLREIEEHPHITSDPKRSVPCNFSHAEGHRCAAAIAARWREGK